MQIIRFKENVGNKAHVGQFGELLNPIEKLVTVGMNLNPFHADADTYELIDIKSILGATLFAEDDALTPDRERMVQAFRRITGIEFAGRGPLVMYEDSDCIWEIYNKWVICRSYPGNNYIYDRLQ